MGEWSQDEKTHIQDFNTFTKVFFISGLLPHIREFVYKNADDTESLDEVLKTALSENGSMEMKGTQLVSTIEQMLEDEEMAINLINKKKKAKDKEDKSKLPKKKKIYRK